MKQRNLKQLCLAFCLLISMGASAQTTAVIGGLKYSFEGTSAYIIGYDAATIPEDLVIPETVEYSGLTFNVTSIEESAFDSCNKIRSLKINQSLQSIGNKAFQYTSLNSIDVVLESGGIGERAFYRCRSLQKAKVNCPFIGHDAFEGCSNLTDLTLCNTFEIYESAFYECTNLKWIDFGNSLRSIGGSAFKYCTSLTYLVFPQSLTMIGTDAFLGCNLIQSIIYLGLYTSSVSTGLKNVNVYILKNGDFGTWDGQQYAYTGVSPNPPTFTTSTLPAGFQLASGYTMPTLEKNVGTYNISIPMTFANNDMSFTADIPYSYTITPATLAARVKDVTKVYGDANPQFQTEYTGFISGEDASVITNKGTYSTSATASSAVGTYTVTQSGVIAQNYTVQYEPGTLTVMKAPLIMTPRDKSMTYGDRMPTFDAEYEGLRNNESKPTWTTEPSIASTATATSNAGTYPINITGGVAQNYNVTFNQGTLTINKAALTATTLDATREYGDDNPDFAFTYSGLKNNETAPSWAVAPTFASPATKTSPAGTYGITATGGEARNYVVQFVNTGKLTVTKAPLTCKARNYTKKQGNENPTFAIDYTGFKNGETKLALTKEPIATTSATRTSRPGTYEITVSGGIALNYELNYVNGTLTIIPNDNPGDQTDNVLTIDNIKGTKNTQVTLPIALTNKHQITGLQMDLYLPDGVTVATNSKGKMLITPTSRMEGNYSVTGNVMDGYVRIVGYSADSDPFTGSEGEILNVTLNIGNSIADGDYTIRLQDIVLSDVNNTEFHPADVGANLTVVTYTLGDVDNSGAININDVVCIINYILHKTNGVFIEEAADVDGSGTININDVVTLINRYILHRESTTNSARKDGAEPLGITDDNYLHLSDIDINPGETKTVQLLMTNANTVSAIQGNIKLPAGLSFVTKSNGRPDVANLNDRAEDFTLSCAVQTDGSLTFAQYSGDGFTYDGNEGGIFTFKIKADEDATSGIYGVGLSDVVLSIGGVGYDIPNRTSSLTISGTTAIISIDNGEIGNSQDKWYTIDGRRLTGKPTKSGVYINGGKKVAIK